MKKKIVSLALAVCLLAIAAVGTLAYFTDKTEVKENVFTAGNVNIDLIEDFEPNSKLLPGVDVNKDVFVKNVGTETAYVRVHIAIPADVDDGDPAFNASHNLLHFNFTKASVADGEWSWTPSADKVGANGVGYLGNGAGNWNFYTTTVDNVKYNVYVVTYRTALGAGEITNTQALDKVYIDVNVKSSVDANGHTIYTDNNNHSADMNVCNKILVVAEGCQAAGFDDAFTALNTAFGVPSSTNNPFNA